MTEENDGRIVAQALTRSLLQRFAREPNGNFGLQGPITADEMAALQLLAGARSSPTSVASLPNPRSDGGPEDQAAAKRFPAPAIVGASLKLNLDCFDAQPEIDDDVVAIDFGTAYSKAALWKSDADEPTPLTLSRALTGADIRTLDSALYITEGAIRFGPAAMDICRRENRADRLRFDSPKQELSIVGGQGLDDQVSPSVDPHRLFTKRDLLTLYLAFLSAMTGEELLRHGVNIYALRKFAVPVWNSGQLKKVARQLRHLLLDGQIVADTLPADVWAKGLAVDDAKRVLDDLNRALVDDERDKIRFIGSHVTEAGAAAAAIGQKLRDRRPVALVMDVGAGTTDMGLYRFRLAGEGNNKIFPFENGSSAIKKAGDFIDNCLIDFIKVRAHLDDHSAHGRSVLSVLRRDIRVIKADFLATGQLDQDVFGDLSLTVDEFLAAPPVKDLRANLRSEVVRLIDAVGFDKIKQDEGYHVVLTGGGSKLKVFGEVFDTPFETAGGNIFFERTEVEPDWLDVLPPAYREEFPQSAVSVGACSPYLPEEGRAISDASTAPLRVMGPNYTSPPNGG